MACKESICRNCFHSYVCEQFNENKDDNNEKCHFANDHYIPRADVAPKSEVAKEIFAKVRKAFYDVSSALHYELTKAILNDNKYTIDLLSGEDEILRAVRRIIEEFAKKYTEDRKTDE